jgi:hypothetical protein
MRLNMHPENDDLWGGCRRSSYAGKLDITEHPIDASKILRRNLQTIFAEVQDRREIILQGQMAAWAYLIVFEFASKFFANVYYADKNGAMLLLITHREP